MKLNNWLFLVKAKLDERVVLLIGGSVVMLLYGDVVVDWAGSILHYAIEVLELGLEHLIESIFHVSRRTAQILTAWTGLLIFLVLGWFIVRMAVNALRERITSWSGSLSKARVLSRQRLAVYASLLIAVFFVFYLQF
ncbi:hypothetical protein [Methylocaldum sp.]|uniref:hypothetical protein n=1 Tax=Methylocaldum sp. TaxID=1969727 RepID=UPI002D77660E|nr:hypothetical protein [Methylocaldum sp.]